MPCQVLLEVRIKDGCHDQLKANLSNCSRPRAVLMAAFIFTSRKIRTTQANSPSLSYGSVATTTTLISRGVPNALTWPSWQ